MNQAAAIILAGGLSSRMGQPKALLPVNGITLIEYICQQLETVFTEIIISASSNTKLPPIKHRIVSDDKPGVGPLMGLTCALTSSTCEKNFVISCDMPDVRLATAERLLSAVDDFDAAMPVTDNGYIQPLFAAYKKSTVPVARRLLAGGQTRPRMLIHHLNVKIIRLHDYELPPNLNTPDEYSAYFNKSHRRLTPIVKSLFC